MQIKETSAAKRKVKKYDTKIINSSSPFSAISYLKEQKIDNFVGRKHDLRYLSQFLYDSINNDRSFGITFSGPGGCGKSTLFGYFVQLINTQELFQKDYCILKREDCLIIPCFIDAPKGEPASLLYFWVSIIDSLAEEGMDFLEKFTLLLSIKFNCLASLNTLCFIKFSCSDNLNHLLRLLLSITKSFYLKKKVSTRSLIFEYRT